MQFGRGPTKTRTAWAGPDTSTVTLEETLTPAEQNLVRLGAHDRLRESQMYGLAVEVFVLHPDGYDGPSRIEVQASGDAQRG